MLHGGGNDMPLPCRRAVFRPGEDGLIVPLAAPGGEIDLSGARPQLPRNGLPGPAQLRRGLLPQGMDAGGVAVGIQSGDHRVPGGGADFCGGGVVKVDHSLAPLSVKK